MPDADPEHKELYNLGNSYAELFQAKSTSCSSKEQKILCKYITVKPVNDSNSNVESSTGCFHKGLRKNIGSLHI